MSNPLKRRVKFALSASALASLSFLTTTAHADTLKVCSDPDNLPFSKAEGIEKGLYIELAEMIGKQLDSNVEYVWSLSFNQRRAIRNTIESCDTYFALPADAEYRVRGLVKSSPFLSVSYAIVTTPDLKVGALSDLKGKTIGVLHGSPPQILLATQEGYTARTFRSQEEVFAALESKEIQAGLLWGPSAGFDNKTLHQNRWQIIPIKGEGLGGQVAVAVSKDKPELKDRINQALETLKPAIEQLTVKYGFPLQTPLQVNQTKASTPLGLDGQTPRPLQASHKATNGFIKVADKASKSTWVVADASEGIAAAKSNFNNKCSHCHGSNGASPVSERDLRKLSTRYKDEWKSVAYTTITKGRPELGMPTWGGILPDEEIKAIIEFLVTVHKN